MAGNIWEWCSTEVTNDRYSLKGSSFNSPFEYAKCYSNNDALHTMKDNDTGFRCIKRLLITS